MEPENANMKTLRPTRGSIRGSILAIIVVYGSFIVAGIAMILKGVIIVGLFGIFFGLTLGSMDIDGIIKKERGHMIQYGDGKLIIRRRSKLCKRNGTPMGDLEIREDVILLEEIERYGQSMSVFGRNIEDSEYNLAGKYLSLERFIKLKSGRYIGFSPLVYTKKQMKELDRYLLEEAGIEWESGGFFAVKEE